MKEVAVAMLTIMLSGLLANGIITWREVAVIQEVNNSQDSDIKDTKNKIDDIHWYLIDSKGIKVNRPRN